VWDKKEGGKFSNDFADVELAWTSLDAPARVIRHVWHGMIQQDMKYKEERYHPTQKPIPVMVRAIEMMTEKGDIVLDPFFGSGTTGVACAQTGRRFVGIELDPNYYEIGKKRIQEALMQPRLL
jgi:DNA modification methylase